MTQQSLGLNRNRNGALKEVFKSAAHQVSTQMVGHPLHLHYLRLINAGMKPNLAALTIARKISAAVLAMWKHGEVYEANKSHSKISAQA